MLSLRAFMFGGLPGAGRADGARAIERVLRGLFDHYCEHPEELPRARRSASLATA